MLYSRHMYRIRILYICWVWALAPRPLAGAGWVAAGWFKRCVVLPLTAVTRYVAQVSLTWKPPLSESSKASEIESKETFRTSLSQRGAKVSLDLLKGHS